MKHFFLLLALLSTLSLGAQNPFITEWTFTIKGKQIRFNTLTEGGPVAYTWSASPSGSSGSGSFEHETFSSVILDSMDIAAGDVVTLSMEPTNLRRFFINEGPDRFRLTDIIQWGDVPWSSMESAFKGCGKLQISAEDVPNLSGVTSMKQMFYWASSFNQDIGNWNTENVTNMEAMFYGATDFNQDIGSWNTSAVNNMEAMFYGAKSFNQNIGIWNTGEVTNMKTMFHQATAFNQDIGNWNTEKVTNLSIMFWEATAFNQDIGNWNTEKVTDMSGMFYEATSFNQAIGNWNTGNVTDMSGMFWEATAFNQAIGNWNTEKVTNMWNMFKGSYWNPTAFNQDIGNWNTALVTNMESMFEDATAFNQDIGSWTLNENVKLNYMLDNSGMDCSNYSKTLIGWQSNNPQVKNRYLGAVEMLFSANAIAARNTLTNTLGWIINGDGPSGVSCGINFTTEWTLPSSTTQIVFNVETGNEAVDYTWSALPSGNNGSGSFVKPTPDLVTIDNLDLVAGDVLTISMTSTNLRRFYINNGPDRLHLTKVTQWGDVPWTSMESSFYGCENLQITALDVPDLSGVSTTSRMFELCRELNSPPNINSWNTSAVTDMSDMFSNAYAFNQDISNWNTTSVTSMNQMFLLATSFNQDIGNWNTSNVVDLHGMFFQAPLFNQNIGNWNTEKVTNMSGMFFQANAFNQDIGNWNTASVTNMRAMFSQANAFNKNIGNWNTSSVTDMGGMFLSTTQFNQDIGNWNTASVTDMRRMFEGATSFNQNIGNWNTSAVTAMNRMFMSAYAFNQDIGGWNTENVTSLDRMFWGAIVFNKDISSWNTERVMSMTEMFRSTNAFNQDIANWNTENVIDMSYMFNSAIAFNQDLGSWTLNADVSLYRMLDNSGMDCNNYSKTLIGWQSNNAQVINRTLGADGLQYGSIAEAARIALTTAQNWTIMDAGLTLCVTPITYMDHDTQWMVYPNPSSGVLNITLPEAWVGQPLQLTNIVGQVLEERIINNTAINCTLEDQAPGVYFLQVQTIDGLATKKVIKN